MHHISARVQRSLKLDVVELVAHVRSPLVGDIDVDRSHNGYIENGEFREGMEQDLIGRFGQIEVHGDGALERIVVGFVGRLVEEDLHFEIVVLRHVVAR